MQKPDWLEMTTRLRAERDQWKAAAEVEASLATEAHATINRLSDENEKLEANAAAMRLALQEMLRYLRFCESRTKAICFKAEYSEHAADVEVAIANDAGTHLLAERDQLCAQQQELLNRIGHYEIMVAERDAQLAECRRLLNGVPQ